MKEALSDILGFVIDQTAETAERTQLQTLDLTMLKKEQISFRDQKISLHSTQIAHDLWPELL